MNTAIYLRKSRADDQAVTIEETLRRHKEILLEFSSHHPDIIIYKIFEDVVSGDSLYARPQMLKLLEEAEQERFEAVLCMDIDRLGRGATSEQGLILETFKYHKIKIITPRKAYDLNNDLDEEYAEFETFMARRELKTIKRRLHNGTLKSLAEGCYLCNAPYGYKKCKINKKCTLEINEDEAKFVRMAFEMYAGGEAGTQIIAETLNGLGAVPHRSDHFNRTSIAAMLRNKVYIGKVVWNKKNTVKRGIMKKSVTVYNDESKWLVYDGLHPPIVSEELFNKANALLSSRYHKPYYDGTLQNPLGGILKCQVCGYGMQRRPYKPDRKYQSTHILCGTKGCCASSKLDYVEAAVIESISQKLKELKASKISSAPPINYEPIISGIEKKISELARQKESLHDLLEQGVYTVETYIERSNNISKRREELLKEKESTLKKQTEQQTADVDSIINRMENLLQVYNNSDPATKNLLLKQIIDKGYYYKEKGWKPNQFILTLTYKGI